MCTMQMALKISAFRVLKVDEEGQEMAVHGWYSLAQAEELCLIHCSYSPLQILGCSCE